MVERLALLGREREVEELRRFLDAVPSGPIGLLLEGDAGIGKTSLWREAVSSALDRSYSVLVCRPGESEAQLAFSALGDLLDDVLESASENLPMPQRRALEIALLRAEAEGPSPLPRASRPGRSTRWSSRWGFGSPRARSHGSDDPCPAHHSEALF